jgi:hypothetical protein
MAVLQRSVARALLHPSSGECNPNALMDHDKDLARRLRTYLLEQGVRASDVVDLDGADSDVGLDAGVDVDVEMVMDIDVSDSHVDSVDMDIDVEPREKKQTRVTLSLPLTKPLKSQSNKPKPSTRCTPYRSPSPPPSLTSPPPPATPTLSPPQLVAALTMRHRARVAVRRSNGSDRVTVDADGFRAKPRRVVSPLARFEPYSES